MENNYLTYTAIDLLNDECFIRSVKQPTPEETLRWDQLAMQDETFAKELATARTIAVDLNNFVSGQRNIPEDMNQAIWEQIEDSIHRKKQIQYRKRFIYTSLSIASCILLMIGFYLSHQLPEPEGIDYENMVAGIKNLTKEAGENITLVINEQESIELEGKEASIDYDEEGQIYVNSDKIEQSAVATEPSGETIYNKMIVPKGKRSFMTLSDGSKVWINSGTIVVYPVQFAQNIREIYVEGEVYLDVAHNKEKPFIVKTQYMEVQVLGTEFNISAYDDDLRQHVLLIDGNVEVSLKDKTKAILEPDQILEYNYETAHVSEVTNHDYLAWKEGYYKYKDEPMDNVFKHISRYYGYTITCSEKVETIIISGKLDLKTDFNEVLSVLEGMAPIKIEHTGNQIQVNVKP